MTSASPGIAIARDGRVYVCATNLHLSYQEAQELAHRILYEAGVAAHHRLLDAAGILPATPSRDG